MGDITFHHSPALYKQSMVWADGMQKKKTTKKMKKQKIVFLVNVLDEPKYIFSPFR